MLKTLAIKKVNVVDVLDVKSLKNFQVTFVDDCCLTISIVGI